MNRACAVGAALAAVTVYLEAYYDAASASGRWPWWWRWSTPRS